MAFAGYARLGVSRFTTLGATSASTSILGVDARGGAEQLVSDLDSYFMGSLALVGGAGKADGSATRAALGVRYVGAPDKATAEWVPFIQVGGVL